MAENGHGVRAQSVQAWVIEDKNGRFKQRGVRLFYTRDLSKARIYESEARALATLSEYDIRAIEAHVRPVVISLD